MQHRLLPPALGFILALTIFSIFVVWPDQPDRYLPDFFPWPSGQGFKAGDFDREEMRLGLDLKGGTRVLLEADTQGRTSENLDQSLDGAVDIIERRVNAFGVSEAEVQRQGSNRISVQLPSVTPEEASNLIGRTAELQFRQPRLDGARNIVCTTPDGGTVSVVPGKSFGPSCLGPLDETIGQIIWEPASGPGNGGAQKALTGRFLRDANPQFDALGRTSVAIRFNREGQDIFSGITSRLVGYPLAIFVDDELISAPVIQTPITGGEAQITGVESAEARTLSAQLNAGSLPVPLKPIQVQEIDATLGDDSVRMSVQAGVIGILVVMIFMIAYYRVPGILAALALITYASTLLMIFKLWPITLSLAGIAAFVLSVGMAVDANILIFERMKEELRGGRNLVNAIDTGFQRAWTSIRDSNFSSLITCGILYWFGSQFDASLVKGFAVTLAIGILISLFTAIFVTRSLLHAWLASPFTRRLWWFGLASEESPPLRQQRASQASHPEIPPKRRPPLDFSGRRGMFYLLSVLFAIPGVISLLIPPALNPGIEFASGSTFTIRFQQDVSQEDLRSALADLGHPEARVQKASDDSFVVRTDELSGTNLAPPLGPAPPSERETIESKLISSFGTMLDDEGQVVNRFLEFESISASVSRDIGRNAAIAVSVAGVAILLYVSWAFLHVPNPFIFGVAAIVALMHDVLITVGLFSIFGKAFDAEVNTMFITALLTIIGFSVHDTIVVFDRIRENLNLHPNADLSDVVNASLTETLARSLGTSLTLVFTILALLLVGGSTIRDFLLVLLVGITSGTYSSIFIASQLLISWDRGMLSRLRHILPKPAPAEA